MAQKDKSVSPPVLPGEAGFDPALSGGTATAEKPKATPRVTKKEKAALVMIEVPVKKTDGPVLRQVTISTKHARTLRQVLDGAMEDGAKLKSGKIVAGIDDALAYLLELIEDGVGTSG